MQTCRHCNTNQLDGAIFCSECGANLIAISPRKETTASLGTLQGTLTSFTFSEELAPTVEAMPSSPPVGQQIYIVVLNSGRRLTLEAHIELLIGRKDNTRGIYPHIDLGNEGGYEAGVSRRHAVIKRQNGLYVLEDLNSANGTFMKGKRLQPHTPTPIHHQDEFAIGTLLLRFEMH